MPRRRKRMDYISSRSAVTTSRCMSTIEFLLGKTRLSLEEITQRSGLEPARVEAIAIGRWPASPAARTATPGAVGVPATEISWGHRMNPRNVRYGRFGLKEDF